MERARLVVPLAGLLAAGALAAILVGPSACDDPKPSPGVTTTSSTGAAPGTSAAVVTTASSAAAPPSTSALPDADPTSVHGASPPASAKVDAGAKPDATSKPAPSAKAEASAKPDASAKPAAKPAPTVVVVDAGASDAGAGAALPGDAGKPVGTALAIARQVDAIFAAKKTFAARFKQQYTLKATGVVKDSSGSVSMERPDKISFRYDPPSKNRIVSDGKTIKIYIAEDSQMMEIPAQKTAYPGALAFMMGNGISTSFDFAVNEKVKWPGTVLDGKPLTPNPSYETVMFYIDTTLLASADPNAVKRVLLIDAQGNKNRFDFEGATQPASFPADEFSFTPPPGTDIKK